MTTQSLHERTAQAIEALFRAKLDDHYSDLAHHYSRSGNTEKAVEYLHLRATGGTTLGQRRSDQSSDYCLGVTQDLTGHS